MKSVLYLLFSELLKIQGRYIASLSSSFNKVILQIIFQSHQIIFSERLRVSHHHHHQITIGCHTHDQVSPVPFTLLCCKGWLVGFAHIILKQLYRSSDNQITKLQIKTCQDFFLKNYAVLSHFIVK